MTKYEYKKEGKQHYSIGNIDKVEKLQNDLKELGLKVSFHPTHLRVYHCLDEEDYKYFKEE